jgi:general secretion pathway protein K
VNRKGFPRARNMRGFHPYPGERRPCRGAGQVKAVPGCLLFSDRGIALLMVLWILAILTVIVFSFSFSTRTETHGTFFFKEGIERRFLAEAGVERGVMELFHRRLYKNMEVTVPGNEAVKVDGTSYEEQLGNDLYAYRIIDESGKINLNTLTDVSGIILDNLLVNRGVPKEQADTIVDSLLDWKDEDELTRLHGAESDYYTSLPDPYSAKNSKMDTVEELLMVKGMTPGILYGGDGKSGIKEFLTVHSREGRINVNAASREVLAALPGMTPEIADETISLREQGEIRTMQDIKPVLGEGPTLMTPYITFSESTVYTIEATGYKKGERQGFTIESTVTLLGNDSYRYLYYKSPAGARQRQQE